MAVISDRWSRRSRVGAGPATSSVPAAIAASPVERAAAVVRQLPLATHLRLAVAAGCGVLAIVQGVPLAAIAAVVVALAEFTGERVWRLAACGQAVTAAIAVLVTVPRATAALPLLLLAVFRAGDVGQPRDVVAATTATAVTLLGGWQASHAGAHLPGRLIAGAAVWIGLAAGLGMLQCLCLRQTGRVDSATEYAAREAADVVHRLGQLVRQLPNGLHAPAVAGELLDAVLAGVPGDRAAVLVRRDGDIASPLVVRGAERVPWRDPVREPGTPAIAWRTRTAVTEVRLQDGQGRRHGSAMLCLPLLDVDDVLIGLVVIERLSPTAFTDAEVACAVRSAGRLSPHLQAALMFGDLQVVASVAERERLAREMHDGIAQDLVALAFSLEVLGRQLHKTSPDAEKTVLDVRSQLTRMVGDIRCSISDLRSGVRPERGLGAALSSQVQSVSSSTGMTVHLSLRESTFRLSAQVEAGLLRAAQSMLHDVRANPTASEIWLSLDVEPPRAELVIRHDGSGDSRLNEELSLYLAQLGVVAVEASGELRLFAGPLGEGAPALASESRA